MKDLYLNNKEDLEICMKRIKAWYFGEIIDRPPVNLLSWYPQKEGFVEKKYANLRDQWMDAEHLVDRYLNQIEGRKFIGESFPMWMPNLGPNVYSAFFGADIVFEPSTTWLTPCIKDWSDLDALKFDFNNPYFKKIEEMTKYALSRCEGNFLVGYTDLHPGLDCVSAWRDPQELCFDLYDNPDEVIKAVKKANEPFIDMVDRFHSWSASSNNISITWLGLPFEGKMNIPSCDFSSMISTKQFEEFAMPALLSEVKAADYNIFHVDGAGVANHLEQIMSLPNTGALQWVQGEGESFPIMQWIPLIQRMLAGGKSVNVILSSSDLDSFMDAVPPKGILLTIFTSDDDEKVEIIKKVEKWR